MNLNTTFERESISKRSDTMLKGGKVEVEVVISGVHIFDLSSSNKVETVEVYICDSVIN